MHEAEFFVHPYIDEQRSSMEVAQLQIAARPRAESSQTEGDPFGGPVAMRLGVGGSWSTVERTRMG